MSVSRSIANSTIANALQTTFGKTLTVENRSALSGGCINQAECVTLSNGQQIFLKSNRTAPQSMFQAEAAGLEALAASQQIRIPSVYAVGSCQETGSAFLLMEMISQRHDSGSSMSKFGARLAELHRSTTTQRFGFHQDNFLGATPQSNSWSEDWIEFWREQRLLDMKRRLLEERPEARPLAPLIDRLSNRLPELLGKCTEPPTLIHGDLWSGNYLIDTAGNPVLIDPACYFGKREAELAMTELFGGFPQEFYRSYCSTWPLQEDHKTRIEVYKLHHLLNHLLLFGSSYYESCHELLARLTS